jgi:CheY-like chemotaxis protein
VQTAMAQRRPRALVVDDDPIVLTILTSLLDELGIECVQARDGRSGLRRLSEDLLTLDLLVTDLMMPDLSGDALVMAVRVLGGERELPIVVASAFLDPARAQALRVAGADAVVDKSSGLGPVAAAVRSLLAARGQLEGVQGELEAAVQDAADSEPVSVPLFRIGLTRAKQ